MKLGGVTDFAQNREKAKMKPTGVGEACMEQRSFQHLDEVKALA